MVPTEELRSSVPSAVADLRDIPLVEMQALGSGELGKAVGRVLSDPSADPVPVAAFQSSI